MSNADDRDAILRKIRALSALGGDQGATEAEAENALRFARALMLKHSVDESEIHAKAGTEERTTYTKEAEAGLGQRHSAWEGYLASAICELVGTVGSYRMHSHAPRRSETGSTLFGKDGRIEYGAAHVFYGPDSDVREARAMFREWSVLIASLARLKYGGALRGPGASYAAGFATSLFWKVRAIRNAETRLAAAQERKELAVGSPEHAQALVLVSALPALERKKREGAAWLRANGVRLSSNGGRGASINDYGAYSAGQRDGSAATFARTSQAKRLGR